MKRNRGFTLIELMIVVAIIGILAAIAIPNFIRFQARSKQSEPKANLKALFTSERSFFQEKDKYSASISEVGFQPERGNRYAYRNDATCVWQARSTVNLVPTALDSCIEVDTFKYSTATAKQAVATTAGTATFSSAGAPAPTAIGVTGTCPACSFWANAAGNVDNEATGVDTWIISSQDATVASSPGNTDTAAPAGQPYNSYNDVSSDT